MQSSSRKCSSSHSNGDASSPSVPGAFAKSILDREEANTFPAVVVDMVSEADRASAENSLTQMQSPSLRKAFHDSLVVEENKFRKLIWRVLQQS